MPHSGREYPSRIKSLILMIGILATPASIGLPPAPAAAAVAFGLDHTAVGAATITVVGTSFADRRLEVRNIGSSGNDGVSVQLPNSNGVHVVFAEPTIPPPVPIVHRDLAARSLVSGAMTDVVVTSATQVGPDCVVTSTAPGLTEMTVEIWDGNSLRYSALMAAGTPLTVTGMLVDEPGTSSSIYANSKRCPRCSPGHVTLLKRTASSAIVVGGQVYVGNAILCSFDTPSTPARYAQCRLTASTGGGGGGTLAISEEGVTEVPPKGGTPGNGMAVVTAVSGALMSSTSPGEISIAPDGTGEDVQLRLNGLPPGVPYIGELDLLRSVACSMSPDYMTGAGPTTMTLEADVACDAGTGTLTSCPSSVTWTLGPAGYDYTVSGGGAGGGAGGVIYLFGGAEVARSSAMVSMSSASPPQSIRVAVERDVPIACLGFPGGTTATLDGVVTMCDSAIVELPTGGPVARRISDVRIVHPPGTPPGTWRSFLTVDGDLTVEGAGLVMGGRGPRQSVSLDGSYSSGPLSVRNIGSSGQDGVDVRPAGARAIEMRLPEPTGPSVGPASLELSAYRCAGTLEECENLVSSLRVHGLHGTATTAELEASFEAHGSNPLYVEAGGMISSYLDLDSDGDGMVDLTPSTPDGVQIAGVQYRHWTPRTQSQTVEFRVPVIITINGSNFGVDKLTVWRNRGGGTLGSDATEPDVMSLHGLPPGTPVLGTLGVCDLSIERPAVQSAGPFVGAPGVASTINGYPIVPTWMTSTEPVLDPDNDGIVDILISERRLGIVSYGGTATATAVLRSPSPLGAAVQCDLPALSALPNPVSVLVQLVGANSPNDICLFDVTARTGGGSTVVAVSSENAGNNINWQFRAGGVIQGTFTGQGTIGFTGPPSSIEFVGDPDFDLLRIAGFPPGTQVFLGGAPVACDEVFVEATAVAHVISRLHTVRMTVSGMEYGQSLRSVRMAEFANAPVLAADPRIVADELIALSAPVPNPSVGGGVSVAFAMSRGGPVRATIVDLSGRRVARLADRDFAAGEHTLHWNGRVAGGGSAPAGLYFVRVERDGAPARTARFTVLR